ncbi:MAG: alpha-galactosidase [Lentisphaeria bacterium]|nr:MAG: alpha-galactosidase [Lentisphaeria bacterium]
MKQISFDSSGKKFLLQTSDSSYGLGISPATGFPVHLHFGEKLRTPDELPAPEEVQNLPRIRETRRRHTFLEYPAFHSAHYTESCLLALHSSGARGTRLEFDSFRLREEADSETLELLLVDRLHQLFVTLVYTVYPDSPLLDRRAVIRNGGTAPVTLRQAFSASLPLPGATHRTGSPTSTGAGRRKGRSPIPFRRRGNWFWRAAPASPAPSPCRSSRRMTVPPPRETAPSYSARSSGAATGRSSSSGMTASTASSPAESTISIFSGIFSPGAVFETPTFTFGFTGHGFGEMFRQIHRHIRTRIEPECTRNRVMPLLCNTYGAFRSGEKMNAANTELAIRKAAEIGAELFVFDAGWQETLGDWIAHREKFHGTIRPQAELAHRLGMKFGVWAELESADRASSIFRNHREWFMQYPDQFPADDELDDSASGRMLLNLTLPEVEEYLYRALDSLIRENELDYFKLDMNRLFTHPGSPAALPEGAQSFCVRYVQALYRIFERIRRNYPNLLLENCACGNFPLRLGVRPLRLPDQPQRQSGGARHAQTARRVPLPPSDQSGRRRLSHQRSLFLRLQSTGGAAPFSGIRRYARFAQHRCGSHPGRSGNHGVASPVWRPLQETSPDGSERPLLSNRLLLRSPVRLL